MCFEKAFTKVKTAKIRLAVFSKKQEYFKFLSISFPCKISCDEKLETICRFYLQRFFGNELFIWKNILLEFK